MNWPNAPAGGSGRSVLENAGMSSLQNGAHSQEAPDQQQAVSFARNFKMRLFNGDLEQEKSREAAKEKYKRELALQMESNFRRKEEEKQREKELKQKYERAFYEQRKQLDQGEGQPVSPATRNNNPQQQPQRNNNRSVSEKYIGSVERKPTFKDKQSQQQHQYIDGLLGRSNHTYEQPAPSLLMKRNDLQQPPFLQYNTKEPSSAFAYLPPDPVYEQQRLNSIHQFQESILKKIDQLRFDIGKASSSTLETNREVDRIRALLRNRDLLQFDISLASSQARSQVRERFQSDTTPSKSIARRRQPQAQYSPSLQDSGVSGGYRQLQAHTEVRYPDREQAPQQHPVSVPAFTRIPPVKSESSEAEEEEYDKVEVPELPYRQGKPTESVGMSKFAPERTNPLKPIRDVSFDRANFVPKSEIIDYKIESMLNNIDNLIDHYDKD